LFGIQASVNQYLFTENGYNVSELHLYILGSSVNFVPNELNNELLSAGAIVTILYKQGEEVTTFEKYVLTSSLSSQKIDFSDIKRFKIKPGKYKLEIEIKDLNNEQDVFYYEENLTVSAITQNLYLSNIKLIKNIDASTGAIDVLPYHLYGETCAQLIAYNEIDNANFEINEPYFIKLSIMTGYAGEIDAKEVVKKHKRLEPKDKEKIYTDFDISNLKSGNYHFNVSLYTKEKQLIKEKSVNFIRYNPKMDAEGYQLKASDLKYTFVNDLPVDSLNYILKAHVPIVNNTLLSALNYITKDSTEGPKRAFIFQYWNEVYKDRAELNFNKYMQVVRSVDKEYYNTVGAGYETDRGYVFLKYGRPNDIISVEDDPAAPPYEIWYYDYIDITNQSNVKFIFYCPTLVNNHYDILHSTCRNEVNNPQWEIVLYRNSPDEIIGTRIDGTEVQDNWARQAKRLFNQN
jgi:GWxTD domain-containing protein